MKIKLLQGLLASTIALAASSYGASAPNENSAIGINLTGLNYWSPQWTLIDVIKHASNGSGTTWAYRSGAGWNNDQSTIDLDTNGWPRSLPHVDGDDKTLKTIIYQDNHDYKDGEYTILYDGEGEVSYDGVTYLPEKSSPGRHVVQLDPGRYFHVLIRETDPSSSGEYIRNIRVLVPGGLCDSVSTAYAESAADCDTPEDYAPFEDVYQNQTFHPLFLQDMSKFRSIRSMKMMAINKNGQSDWDSRASLNDATWSSEKGVPIEMVIGLSNKTQAEPWLNIPARANDSYMRQYAELVLDTLDSNLAINLELGNEIWNNAYPFVLDAIWMREQGLLEWPDADVTTFEYRLNYFGKRTAEMCAIWKDVFAGQAERVQCVMGGMAANSWVSDKALSCPLFAEEENGYPCARDMHSLTIAPYFGGHLKSDRYGSILTDWLSESDGGLTKMFEELNTGVLYDLVYDPTLPSWMLPPQFGALNQSREFSVDNKVVADEYGIALTAYEGGQHLTFEGNVADWRSEVNEQLFLAGNRDPRMGEVYIQNYTDWKDLGGELFMAFESTESFGSSGAFPLKEYQTQPMSETPKLAATLEFIDNNPCWWAGCERTTNAKDKLITQFVISATSTAENYGIHLGWSYANEDVSHFGIYHNGTYMGHAGADALSFDKAWLELRTLHTFKVQAMNGSDEILAESNEVVLMSGDSIAPSTPAGLTVVFDGAYGFNVSWNAASDNTGVEHYSVIVNGEHKLYVTGLSHADPYASQGGVSYQIVAYDHYGNASEPSDVVTGVMP